MYGCVCGLRNYPAALRPYVEATRIVLRYRMQSLFRGQQSQPLGTGLDCRHWRGSSALAGDFSLKLAVRKRTPSSASSPGGASSTPSSPMSQSSPAATFGTLVQFENGSKEKLVGSLVDASSSADGVVILCHGYASSKNSPLLVQLAKELASKNLSSLRFDFSGNGAFLSPMHSRMGHDALMHEQGGPCGLYCGGFGSPSCVVTNTGLNRRVDNVAGDSEGVFQFANYTKEALDLRAAVLYVRGLNRYMSVCGGKSMGGAQAVGATWGARDMQS